MSIADFWLSAETRGRKFAAGGDAARDRKEWLAAARLYEAALKHSCDRGELWIQLGNMLKEGGKPVSSYAAYSNDAVSPSGDWYLQLGHLFKVTGNFHYAKKSYRSAAISGDPRGLDELSLFPNNASPNGVLTRDDEEGHILVDAICWCESDFNAAEIQKRAAGLLIEAGFPKAAKAFFEMSFIRAGVSADALMQQQRLALLTGLWHVGGPLAIDHDRSAMPLARPLSAASVARWSIEFLEGDCSFSPPSRALSDFLFHSDTRLASILLDKRIDNLPHDQKPFSEAMLGPTATLENLANLIDRLYVALLEELPSAALSSTLADIRAELLAHQPTVTFASMSQIELLVARVLINNLSDFFDANYHLTFGPFASPRLFWLSARFADFGLSNYFREPLQGATNNNFSVISAFASGLDLHITSTSSSGW